MQSAAEYTHEFHCLSLRNNPQETEEQFFVRFVIGLKVSLQNKVGGSTTDVFTDEYD